MPPSEAEGGGAHSFMTIHSCLTTHDSAGKAARRSSHADSTVVQSTAADDDLIRLESQKTEPSCTASPPNPVLRVTHPCGPTAEDAPALHLVEALPHVHISPVSAPAQTMRSGHNRSESQDLSAQLSASRLHTDGRNWGVPIGVTPSSYGNSERDSYLQRLQREREREEAELARLAEEAREEEHQEQRQRQQRELREREEEEQRRAEVDRRCAAMCESVRANSPRARKQQIRDWCRQRRDADCAMFAEERKRREEEWAREDARRVRERLLASHTEPRQQTRCSSEGSAQRNLMREVSVDLKESPLADVDSAQTPPEARRSARPAAGKRPRGLPGLCVDPAAGGGSGSDSDRDGMPAPLSPQQRHAMDTRELQGRLRRARDTEWEGRQASGGWDAFMDLDSVCELQPHQRAALDQLQRDFGGDVGAFRLLRLLLASGSLEAARAAVRPYQELVDMYAVGSMRYSDVAPILETQSFYYWPHCTTKEGEALLYLCGRAVAGNRKEIERAEELVPRAVLAVLEHCVESEVSAAAAGVCLLCDLSGMGVAQTHFVASIVQRVVQELRGRYPLLLRRVLVVGAGTFCGLAAKATLRRLCPALAAERRALFLTPEELPSLISAEHLPFQYGGSRSIDYADFTRDCAAMFLPEQSDGSA
eukprot:TRINITY_DN4942_c1_g2_i1.p1 TRINITY_DN4942_c1_g2~~TRINITY_DN4942_c1_g2_i1.p1  ORF type:complete len:651 (+),score=232.48 TRINITY_DN4942_c1_g2_i1:81-2033(+)